MAKKSNFSERKQNIIAALLEEYDIWSIDDILDALKNLLVRYHSEYDGG